MYLLKRLALLPVVSPFIANAQAIGDVYPAIPNTLTTETGLISVIKSVGNLIFAIFGVVAVIFILLAAFNYLTAAGDEKKLGTGKQMLMYAIIAVAVAVLAPGIVNVIIAFLT